MKLGSFHLYNAYMITLKVVIFCSPNFQHLILEKGQIVRFHTQLLMGHGLGKTTTNHDKRKLNSGLTPGFTR